MENLLRFSLFCLFVISCSVVVVAQDCTNATDCDVTMPYEDYDTTTIPPGNVKTCDVAVGERKDCLADNEPDCTTYNCCWDQNPVAGAKQCFYKGFIPGTTVKSELTTDSPITEEVSTAATLAPPATETTVRMPPNSTTFEQTTAQPITGDYILSHKLFTSLIFDQSHCN
eukprot:GHVO01020316.1.p1 GENE.GHVO01020316.1~~GHVO01020316.1.p1  ORF type:complete len:170 (+),score=3.22 GHVO01020316.1:125-634(+)